MAVDRSIIDAITSALQKESDSVPLRIYLGSLFLHGGENSLALDNFSHVLNKDPANVEALKGAAAAAAGLGDSQRAEGYRKLLLSLGAGPILPPVSPSDPPALRGASVQSEGSPKAAVSDRNDDEDGEADLVERPKVTLADVGGMEEVKRRLNLAFLAPLRNPKMREVFGKSLC